MDKIKITDITPAMYNPRLMSADEFNKLSDSIAEFGLVDPIIINLNNNCIIGGHQRYDVLLSQGVKELNLIKLGDIGWCFTEDDLTVESEVHEKALNLALNRISGEWDFDKLDIVLDDLELNGFDVGLVGFDKSNVELDNILGEDEDYIPNFQPVEDDGTRLDMKNQYSVYIKLENENEQEELYERLKEEGYKCTKN